MRQPVASTTHTFVQATRTLKPTHEATFMTVRIFPGDLRIGVLNRTIDNGPQPAADPIDPKFKVMVLLSGLQRFTIDGNTFELDARTHPVAMMMHLTCEAMLHYKCARGAPYRKIALATPNEWLHQLVASGGTLSKSFTPSTAGLSHHLWTPDAEIIRLATQILAPPPQGNPAQVELFRMSRGLELIRRALATHPEKLDQATSDAHPIAERIRLYVLQNICQDLTLARIEQDLGMNRRSIQRHFKTGTGITLSDFMRRERLAKARQALSEDGITIAQAAHLAGYSTPENFSTAFRQAFGMAPHNLRNCTI